MNKKKTVIFLYSICFVLIIISVVNYLRYEKIKLNSNKLKYAIQSKENEIRTTKNLNTTLISDYKKLKKEKENIMKVYNIWEQKNKEVQKHLQQ